MAFLRFSADCFASKEANARPEGDCVERPAQSIGSSEAAPAREAVGSFGVWGVAPRSIGHRDATSMTRKGQPEGPSYGLTVAQSSGFAKRRVSVAMAGVWGLAPKGFPL